MRAENLLAAVLADPDDDAVRLVYADWLEEEGDDDRAAFIRAQVRLAHFEWRAIPPGVEIHPGEREALRSQEDEIWGRHQEEWMAELPRSLRGRYFDNQVKFHRGFVEELSMSPARMLRVSGRFWATHPIRQLTVWPERDPEFGRLLALPQLGRIRHLNLMHSPDEAGLAALAGAEGLTGVRVMSVMGGNGDPAWAGLARCPSLRGLADLFLNVGSSNTEVGLAALADSENVGNLVALHIDAIHLPQAGALVVARSPRLAGLERLRLNGHLKEVGARALCESPYLGNLKRLEVTGGRRKPAGVDEALRDRFGSAYVLPDTGEE